ncbi:MAG: AgmX/PglI C-terminal domain-containing protein [Cognaticolwellia sp.]
MSHANLTTNSLAQGISLEFLTNNRQDKKFYTILFSLIALYFIVAIAVPFIERIEVPREIKEKVPAQLTRIVIEKKQLPVPEPIKPKPPEEKVKEPPKPKEKTPKPKPKKVVVKKPVSKRQAAKQKAKSSGLAAMKDELLAMREVLEIKPNASKTLAKADTKQTQIKRKLLAAQVSKTSTALANAKVSQTVASEELSTRNTQRIRLSDQEVIASGEGDAQYGDEPTLANQRSEMQLRRTLESSKARLYALYNRALRKDPLLKGKVVFNIEIQASGEISKVVIDSSELNNAKLERQLLIILRSINFGAEDVDAMSTVWAIEFLPR